MPGRPQLRKAMPPPTTYYHFHVNVLAAAPAPFVCTWEDAADKLASLPRMIFELDGSFVISGSGRLALAPQAAMGSEQAATRWQVDGHLFDFGGRLHRVELHGCCPSCAVDDLLGCLGWPAQGLLFEMVREGVTLDEASFRRAVSGKATA